MNSRTRNRKLLRFLAGGKCRECGCTESLHFHHVDPENKRTEVTRLYGFAAWVEATKCVLLCEHCHSETHKREQLSSHEPFMVANDNGFMP